MSVAIGIAILLALVLSLWIIADGHATFNKTSLRGKEVGSNTIWVCEHHHHSSSRCPECFDPNKKYETVSMSEVMERIKRKKEEARENQ